MTRAILTLILTLLTVVNAAAATPPRRGGGCWRTPKARPKAAARLKSPHRADENTATGYYGRKKGLVILAEFTDKQFLGTHGPEKYNEILNTPGYTTAEGFKGSVADYFLEQSNGLFELQFDVVGPFTTKYNYAYYGKNDSYGYDMRAEEMVIEMCKAADELVDFNDYDWDGDGEVDEVFVVYAGKGEADAGSTNLIWPHMWTLDEAEKELILDGAKINVYACSNEIDSRGRICGIGTFCHEFSHCLGLPDLYDTVGNNDGMGEFDVMDTGLYEGNAFTPVGYNAYEKMVCGWLEPIVLAGSDVSVDSLPPLSVGGQSYIIFNDAWPDEYYMVENRQRSGCDVAFPAVGLMITHIDYDEDVWLYNIVNSNVDEQQATELDLGTTNDHERVTFFNAGSRFSPKLFPYLRKDSLTAQSTPAATLFHRNGNGTLMMQGAIIDITQNQGGTVSFLYRAQTPYPVTAVIQPKVSDARGVAPEGSKQRAYTLDGRAINADATSQLRHGIYIIDGRKVVR